MRSVLYITTFNDPTSCESLLPDMDRRVIEGYDKIISDQSTPEFQEAYQRLAERYGWKYIHHKNGGAMQAKHDIIRHAIAENYDFMAHISEDFEINKSVQECMVPTGSDCFFQCAHDFLTARPDKAFINWSLLRPSYIGWQAGYHIGMNDPLWRIRFASKDQRLLYVEGDICAFNWPYTGRVSALAEILRQSNIMGVNNENNFARASMGLGASLLAFPVIHTNREKPKGSHW